jgi:hypothetical protein
MALPQLPGLIAEFIDRLPEHLGQQGGRDREVVAALSATGARSANREAQVREWLSGYSVLQGFTSDYRDKVAIQIVKFADRRVIGKRLESREAIVEEFAKLFTCLQDVAPVSKSGKKRIVTSLASKALWCCYPQDVPLFDAYVVNALRVLSRIYGMRTSARSNETTGSIEVSEYAAFVGMWLNLYEVVKDVLDQADLSSYPFKVRIFDRFLWDLGQPSFDSP